MLERLMGLETEYVIRYSSKDGSDFWRGAPRPGPQPFLTRLGDLLAGSYGSRDFFYLFLIVAVAHVILPSAGFYGVFLLLSMALVNALWLVLLIMTVLSPRAQEG